MALKKTIIDDTGTTGEYWKITQDNFSEQREDGVVDLEVYVSQAMRDVGKNSLTNESKEFNFREGDHPLSELDPDSIDTDLVVNSVKGESWVRSFRLHCLYEHIKAIALAAKDKQDVIDASADPESEDQLTQNELLALIFHDAEDVI